MKSGPDVFADALVPGKLSLSRNASFPERALRNAASAGALQ
jgi:hypothetical protein